MEKTIAILFATILVMAATFIPTYLMSRKQGTSEEDWAVASRSLPFYVVVGTQFASAMGGGILVVYVGNAYNNGVSGIIYGALTAIGFFGISILAKWLRHNNFSTVPEILTNFSGENKIVTIVAAIMTICVPFGWAAYMGIGIKTLAPGINGADATNCEGYHGIQGQTTLKTRYIMEDIPYSLVAFQTMGKIADVPTPCIDAMITVAHALIDDIEEGRTAENLGLVGVTKDEFLSLCRG